MDPGQSFFIKKLLKGIQNVKGKADCRLPITRDILHKIIMATDHVVPSFPKAVMCKAMFLLAFHGFLRVGEFTTTASNDSSHVLQVGDAQFSDDGSSLLVTITFYKHSAQQPITLDISRATNPLLCPVRTLRTYLDTYGHTVGPLFQFMDGKPVPYAFFMKTLDALLSFLGLDRRLYRGHSFRIGAATTAAANGVSEIVIQKMGRWKSDAVKRYIRMPVY